jgi:hypothetical protein
LVAQYLIVQPSVLPAAVHYAGLAIRNGTYLRSFNTVLNQWTTQSPAVQLVLGQTLLDYTYNSRTYIVSSHPEFLLFAEKCLTHYFLHQNQRQHLTLTVILCLQSHLGKDVAVLISRLVFADHCISSLDRYWTMDYLLENAESDWRE